MCQMNIILKQGPAEELVLENASLLEVLDGGIRVSTLFEEPKFIPAGVVSHIDFLSGKVIVTRKEGRMTHHGNENNH